MTHEIKPSSDRYSEIAVLMLLKDSSVTGIYPIIRSHVIECHGGDEGLPGIEDTIYPEIEHLDAVLSGRRKIEEILEDTQSKQKEPNFIHASGLAVCPECRKPYTLHPNSNRYLDFQNQPYLKRLCSGELVKL